MGGEYRPVIPSSHSYATSPIEVASYKRNRASSLKFNRESVHAFLEGRECGCVGPVRLGLRISGAGDV